LECFRKQCGHRRRSGKFNDELRVLNQLARGGDNLRIRHAYDFIYEFSSMCKRQVTWANRHQSIRDGGMCLDRHGLACCA
jgi:hypothetical protein